MIFSVFCFLFSILLFDCAFTSLELFWPGLSSDWSVELLTSMPLAVVTLLGFILWDTVNLFTENVKSKLSLERHF